MFSKEFLLTIVFVVFATLCAKAGFTPTAYYTVDGESFEETEAITDVQAPLFVTFKANPDDTDEGENIIYTWNFVKDGSSSPYVIRHEENTEYEFRESGTTTVSFYVTQENAEEELISSITITISESVLEMPNAFSPNGDGINDIYKAKDTHKSIIEFHAYIFNRWGQKLYEWSDINSGWDGTYKGKQVSDGVYYVQVKAKGADGREYNIKRDVNLLRKYGSASSRY